MRLAVVVVIRQPRLSAKARPLDISLEMPVVDVFVCSTISPLELRTGDSGESGEYTTVYSSCAIAEMLGRVSLSRQRLPIGTHSTRHVRLFSCALANHLLLLHTYKSAVELSVGYSV